MKGMIFKRDAVVSSKEFEEACEFENISDFGDVFSYEDFMDMIETGCISDYDGSGELVLFDKTVVNSCISISNRNAYIEGSLFVPFEILHKMFGDGMKFCWYNK